MHRPTSVRSERQGEQGEKERRREEEVSKGDEGHEMAAAAGRCRMITVGLDKVCGCARPAAARGREEDDWLEAVGREGAGSGRDVAPAPCKQELGLEERARSTLDQHPLSPSSSMVHHISDSGHTTPS